MNHFSIIIVFSLLVCLVNSGFLSITLGGPKLFNSYYIITISYYNNEWDIFQKVDELQSNLDNSGQIN